MPDGEAEPVTDAVPGTAAGGLRRAAGRLVTALRVAVALAITAAVVYAVTRQWDQVRSVLARLSPGWVAGAVVAVLAGSLANTLAWRSCAAGLGAPVGVRQAARICLVGQLGKYLPGTVWEFVLLMELGRRAGVPRSRGLLAGLVAAGLGVTAGLAVGAVELPALRGSATPGIVTWILAAVTPVALVCAHPWVLTRLCRVALRVTRQPPLAEPVGWRAVGGTLGWAVLGRLAYGLQLWLLLRAVAPVGPAGLVDSVGAFSLAFTAGLLVIVSPSGLGAREAVLVALLAPLLPGPHAAAIALGVVVASRVVFTAADLLGAGGAALAALGTTTTGPIRNQEAPHPGRT
jgi:uncharacterized membrane protein YbhN (UPF0104 family)